MRRIIVTCPLHSRPSSQALSLTSYSLNFCSRLSLSLSHSRLYLSPCHSRLSLSPCHSRLSLSPCHSRLSLSPCHSRAHSVITQIAVLNTGIGPPCSVERFQLTPGGKKAVQNGKPRQQVSTPCSNGGLVPTKLHSGAGSLVPSEEAASAMVAVLEGAKRAAAKISEAARAAAGPQRAASGVRGQPQNAGATAGAAPRAVAGAKGQGAGAERRAGAAPWSPPSAGAKGQGASAGAARKALSGARGQGASAGGSTGAAPESPPSEGSLGQGASTGAARRALSGARGQGPSAGSAPMAVPGARGQGTSAGAAPRAVAGARGPGTTATAAARALVPVTARTNQQAFVTRAELEAVRAEILRAIAHAPLVPGTAPGVPPNATTGVQRVENRGPEQIALDAVFCDAGDWKCPTTKGAFLKACSNTRCSIGKVFRRIVFAALGSDKYTTKVKYLPKGLPRPKDVVKHEDLLQASISGWHVNPITQHPFATKLFAVAMRRAFTRRGVHLVVWKSRMVAFALFTLENPLLEKATDGKLSNDQSENRTKFHETCDRVRRWVEHSVLKLAVPYDRAAQAYVFGGHGVCIDASDFPQLPRT
ncbi:unnamed protein product [Closterium sp. NIES-64]|nr:unnamed protein product [Closterium sp. NIES-64]